MNDIQNNKIMETILHDNRIVGIIERTERLEKKKNNIFADFRKFILSLKVQAMTQRS